MFFSFGDCKVHIPLPILPGFLGSFSMVFVNTWDLLSFCQNVDCLQPQ